MPSAEDQLMNKVVTYFDTCVFVNAWRANDLNTRTQAERLLRDKGRSIVGCSLLALELLPKPSFFRGREQELLFFGSFLGGISTNVPVDEELLDEALLLGKTYGVSGADAVHAAAAKRGAVDEFVTSESPPDPEKPLSGSAFYRVTSINPVHLAKAKVMG